MAYTAVYIVMYYILLNSVLRLQHFWPYGQKKSPSAIVRIRYCQYIIIKQYFHV